MFTPLIADVTTDLKLQMHIAKLYENHCDLNLNTIKIRSIVSDNLQRIRTFFLFLIMN